ncbi:MAG: glutathione S-transferase [Deltaproteobacteria bacterium]|nr:glutathione S-transferase [Deltaproteobacteria bacterium]
MHQLYGIAFSHYVEKARWALERFSVPYEDKRYLPFLHIPVIHRVHGGRAGKTDRASTRYSTPVLRTPSGLVLADSAAIVAYVSETFAGPEDDLYADPEAAELEQRFHDVLGVHTRRAAYAFLFERPSLIQSVIDHNVSRAQARLFRIARPAAQFGLRRLLRIDEAGVARSTHKTRDEFAAMGERLADGRPFLLGERFSAADLAFAALAAPALLPEAYSAWLPPLEELPPRARALTRELRKTRAGAFVMRLYREERGRVLGRPSAT